MDGSRRFASFRKNDTHMPSVYLHRHTTRDTLLSKAYAYPRACGSLILEIVTLVAYYHTKVEHVKLVLDAVHLVPRQNR